MKLTKTSIERVVPESDDHIVFDETMPGFGLRIRHRKHRTFIAQYKIGTKHRRITLGNAAKVTLDDARSRAKIIFGQVADHKDPAEKRAQARKAVAHSFAATFPKYLEARKGGLKDSTYEAQERHLNSHWRALHDLQLGRIERADVAASLGTITKNNGPIAANRARATLSKFFRWAIGEGLCDHNPVVGTNKRDENDPRERSLSDMETAAIWLDAPDNDYGRILKLILLTGCRRGELGDLKWSELDMEACTIRLPRERTKNGQEHIVPLSDAAISILADIKHRDRDYVFGRTRAGGFSGWSKSKAEVDATVKLKQPWTLHDLRRTVRTGLGNLGVAPHIAEATLNHLPPKLIRTYDRNKYESEKRAALDQWAAHLKTVVAQATGANVTALRNRDSAAGKKR
jgi:integrase